MAKGRRSVPSPLQRKLPPSNFIEFDPSIYDGKSIALVGNSPRIVGTNQGNDIDSNDIVIRCNSTFAPDYPDDLGSKTHVWAVNCCKGMTQPVHNLGRKVIPVCYRDVRNGLKQRQMSHFIRRPEIIEFYNAKCHYLSVSDHYAATQMSRKLGIRRTATVGVLVLCHLLTRLHSIKSIDLFGFGFYTNPGEYSASHSPEQEKEAVLKLTKQEPKVTLHELLPIVSEDLISRTMKPTDKRRFPERFPGDTKFGKSKKEVDRHAVEVVVMKGNPNKKVRVIK